MKRFKNILVVYNDMVGDEDVLIQAIALAERNKARLTLIEVAKNASTSANQLAERRKRLCRVGSSIDRHGLVVETICRSGKPFLEIIRQVLRGQHDLVIMAAEGGGGLKNLFFGGTSMHLMRKCPCPVWILKPGQRTNYTRVLAAVDTDPDDAEVDELNKKIVDLATSLAQMNNSELHVFHAWELTGNDHDTMSSEISDDMREKLLSKNEQKHRKPIERLLEGYALNGLKHQIHVERGVPDVLLPQMVDEENIDLIGMGTVGRSGIAGLLIGDTAGVRPAPRWNARS